MAALAEIEHLFNCAPGTADADRLNSLMDQVEAYDTEMWDRQFASSTDVLRMLEDEGLADLNVMAEEETTVRT